MCASFLGEKGSERCPECPPCQAGRPQRMEKSSLVCVHPSWGKRALRDVLNAHPAFIFAALWRELACKQSTDAWAFFTFRFAVQLV